MQAHHFETMEQQFTSAKLGMWMFLATEVLMFGGLFCAYAIYRNLHPETFVFAHDAYLDKTLGAINTVVLLTSSLTMAWGVRAAQLGQKNLLIGMLILTLLGGFGFMGIKYVEYQAKWDHHVFLGNNKYKVQSDEDLARVQQESLVGHGGGHGEADGHGEAANEAHGAVATHDGDGEHAVDPEHGGETSHEGDADHASGATDGSTDASAVADAESHADEAEHSEGDHSETAQGESTQTASAEASDETPLERSALAPPGEVEAGTVVLAEADDHAHLQFTDLSVEDQKRVYIFFSIYFLMTGLHGIHVVLGMGLIAWLAFKASKGIFGPSYYFPVDIVGLYWHLVDLIWIFLFPLLYLIH